MIVVLTFQKGHFENEDKRMIWVLQNMKGKGANWALMYLIEMSKEPDLQKPTAKDLHGLEQAFMSAFGDPDAERTAEQKLLVLNQTESVSDYTTKFKNLAADINWDKHASAKTIYAISAMV
ncbi:hypothetical protein FRC08_012687, partial [Ceratobasidium sp. 394]